MIPGLMRPAKVAPTRWGEAHMEPRRLSRLALARFRRNLEVGLAYGGPLAGKVVAAAVRSHTSRANIRIGLVAGMSRSGTTFLGNVLALSSDDSLYVHEPVKKVLRSVYGEPRALADEHRFWRWVDEAPEAASLKLPALYAAIGLRLASPRSWSKDLICVKVVSMVEEILEASERLGAVPFFIHRHPCGRTDSLIRQAKKDGLPPLGLADITRANDEWGWVHARLREQLSRKGLSTSLVSFEDLCAEPVRQAERLSARLGCTLGAAARDELVKMTSTASSDLYSVERVASQQTDKWRTSLSPEQVEAVRAGTLPHETGLYDGF